MNREHIDKHFPNDRWKAARSDFQDFYTKNQVLLLDACEAFTSLLNLLLSIEFEPAPKISGRVKKMDECIKKFELKYLSESERQDGPIEIVPKITDLLGLRVVCIYESDIERAATILRENLDVFEETDKTQALELHENQFGYKGLHLDARLNSKRKSLPEYKRFASLNFEIQVRSIVQDAWSEVDHRLKYKKRIPKKLKRRINRLAALFELADQEFEAIRENTHSLEEEGQRTSAKSDANAPLTPFNFGPSVNEYFVGYEFEPFKVDGFVDELLGQNEDLKAAQLTEILDKHLKKVREFKNYLSEPPLNHSMNAFTQIRHCLYLENKVLYEGLMRVGPQKNFDRWLEFGTVHPKEIELQNKYSKK